MTTAIYRSASHKVRLGHVRMSFALPFSAALRQGFFDGEELEVEVSTFSDGWEVARALAAGTIDVGIGGHLQAAHTILGGADLVFLGPLGYEEDPDHLVIMVLGGDGVLSMPDLQGGSVGITTRGGQGELMLALAMEAAGADRGSVEIDVMSTPSIVESLSTGAVDGAIVGEPAATMLMRQGASLLARGSLGSALTPGQRVAITGCLSRRPWVDEDTDRAKRVISAVRRGSALLRKDPVALVEMMAEDSDLPEDLCRAASAPAFPSELIPSDLQLVFDLARRFDLLPGPLDARSIIHPIARG